MNLMPETSEKFDMVLKQLMLAKKEMGCRVKKDSSNPFHKSKYASLASHLELCEGVLSDHGLILVQTVNGDQEKALLVATLCHPESSQWIKSYMPLPNPKGDSQGLGSAVTYMRRYSINSMLGLTAEDDDGESNCIREKAESKKTTPIPVKVNNLQSNYLRNLESSLSDGYKTRFLNWMKTEYKIDSFTDLLDKDY
jgi:hypothetical protein